MPERADTQEVIGLIIFAPLLYSMVPFGAGDFSCGGLVRARRSPKLNEELLVVIGKK